MFSRLIYWLNLAAVMSLTLVILSASVLQFTVHELPCPLCLLQRAGLLLIPLGLLLNLRLGYKPSHYGFSLFGALLTAVISIRQILLHIMPGTGIYGHTVFGLSMYTWAFLIAAGVMLWLGVMFLMDRQFTTHTSFRTKHTTTLTSIAFLLVLSVAGLNVVTTFIECGVGTCPANPISYKY